MDGNVCVEYTYARGHLLYDGVWSPLISTCSIISRVDGLLATIVHENDVVLSCSDESSFKRLDSRLAKYWISEETVLSSAFRRTYETIVDETRELRSSEFTIFPAGGHPIELQIEASSQAVMRCRISAENEMVDVVPLASFVNGLGTRLWLLNNQEIIKMLKLRTRADPTTLIKRRLTFYTSKLET